ncbi:MAG: endospore germination permease [Desulfosporosinus sp.]|nr:endospore germination permease [Desulfosporosinus sp.]
MEQKEKVSGTQVAVLLFIFITATLTLYVPSYSAREAKESAWLAVSVIPLVYGYLTLRVVYKLGCYFPELTFYQYCEVILGKFLGKGLGVIYIVAMMATNILILREFSDFLSLTTLPLTPQIFLLTTIVALASYGAYKGLEVIVRAVQFVFIIYSISSLTIILYALTNFKVARLLPILEEGVLPIIRGSIAPASWYGQIFVVAFIFPFVNKPKELKRKGTVTLVAITVFAILDVAITVGVFGANFTSSITFPIWYLANSIALGQLVQRIESFLLVFWICGIFIKATFFSFIVGLGITQVFGFKNTKAVLSTTAVIEVVIANNFFSGASLVQFIVCYIWPTVGIVFCFFIPLLLLAIAKLRMKHRSSPN